MTRPTPIHQHQNLTKVLPGIRIITTGGTIAGAGTDAARSAYTAGVMRAEDLMASVPELGSVANISLSSPFSKDSANLTESDWLALIEAVFQAQNDRSVDGIVITHGTDSLEETAWLLHLVLPLGKPVVMTGAMRPATALSPDGPMNLFNAVSVASSTTARGRGVLVVMNDTIFRADAVVKTHTTALQAFSAGPSGPLGQVLVGQVSFYAGPAPGPLAGHFAVSGPHVNSLFSIPLPKVAVVFLHAGFWPELLDAVMALPGLSGIVLAGLGDGNIPDSVFGLLQQAQSKQLTVVRSTRIAQAPVSQDYNGLDSRFELICAGNLSPQKARLLLALALATERDNPQNPDSQHRRLVRLFETIGH